MWVCLVFVLSWRCQPIFWRRPADRCGEGVQSSDAAERWVTSRGRYMTSLQSASPTTEPVSVDCLVALFSWVDVRWCFCGNCWGSESSFTNMSCPVLFIDILIQHTDQGNVIMSRGCKVNWGGCKHPLYVVHDHLYLCLFCWANVVFWKLLCCNTLVFLTSAE